MTEATQTNERMTCGEYLNRQRTELAGISDLSAPGAVRKAEECLANIYAVSYQMNFERREPPSPHRGPAEHEELDRSLVAEMSDGLRHKAHAFQGIVEDPWRLSQAMSCARQGNGFPLIEMVNVAFLAGTARSGRPSDAQNAKPAPARQPEKQSTGPVPGL